jgi:hypothetical protein
VNALANAAVGDYLNEHCVSSFQKVGTFKVADDGQKQGGNVATYFCLPDGSVLHILAGPVDADTFLTEAKWVVETRKNALFEARNNPARYREFFRWAHLERLRHDYGVDLRVRRMPIDDGYGGRWANGATPRAAAAQEPVTPKGNANQQQVHTLLAYSPLIKIENVYKYVFEKILNERVSTLPVEQSKAPDQRAAGKPEEPPPPPPAPKTHTLTIFNGESVTRAVYIEREPETRIEKSDAEPPPGKAAEKGQAPTDPTPPARTGSRTPKQRVAASDRHPETRSR